MNISETLQNFSQKLSENLKVGAVFGEPIETHGKLVIPVSSYGFGFGMGGDSNESGGENTPSSESGGGGGGGGADPLGVFEITDMSSRFIPVIRFRELMIGVTILGVHLIWLHIIRTVFKRKKK